MKSIGELSHALKNEINIDQTLVEIAEYAESHYLAYFMDNLSFEITTYFELLSETNNQKLLGENPELNKVVQSITKAWSDTGKWLNPAKRSVSLKLFNLYKYREMLAQQVAVLAAYDDKLKMYHYILRRRQDYSDHLEKISDETFAGELVNFIFEFEDSMTINDRLKGVYGELPIRMSKIKFHEWIEKALVGMKGVSVRDLTNYTTYLKETFAPESVEGYGQVMVDFYREMASFEELLTDIVAAESVGALEDKIVAMQMILDDSVGLYTFTASVLNNMIAILSVLNETSYEAVPQVAEDFVEVMNMIYKRRKEEEVIDEAMVEIFDKMTIRFNEAMLSKGQYDGIVDEVKQSYLDKVVELSLGDRYDKLGTLYVLQSNSYFAPVNISAQDLAMVDERRLIEIRNDLLAVLDKAAKDNTRIEKRARIANLLGVLNVIHQSAQEIHAYILASLNSCRDEREKQGCKQVLVGLMNEI